MAEKKQIEVKVNGTSYKREVEPRLLLGDFLREDLGLTGTHFGCEHGVCGACTVMLNGTSVRSCLMFAIQANGAEIMTVEGIATATRCIRCSNRSGTITAFSADSAHRGC